MVLKAKALFERAKFIGDLGIEWVSEGPGVCESVLMIEPRHAQQNGYVHAGVISTMADHTAGSAAETLAPEGKTVLTAEFKINFLRAAQGERLECRAAVLKPGRMLIIVESEVYAVASQQRLLVAKGMFTVAVIDKLRIT